jgi:hypothetical protein
VKEACFRTTTETLSYDIAEYLLTIGSLPRMQALRIAREIWDRIGRKRIEQHVLRLSAYLSVAVEGTSPSSRIRRCQTNRYSKLREATSRLIP